MAHEEFWVIHLNNNNKILYKQHVSTGGITNTVVDLRIIFKTALEKGSTAIILAHNHPSGNLEPSQNDIALTKRIQIAANYLDIKILDHIIISEKNKDNLYYSFCDNGLLDNIV